MEGINHVDVVEVGGGRLVGNVDRVIQRNVPDRESLPLRVPRLDPALVVVVQLRQAGRHLAGARSRSRHNDEVAAGLHVLVGAVALVRDNALDVRGVAGDREVAVDADAELLEAFLHLGGCLVVVRPLGDDDGTDVQATLAELVDLAQNLVVVGGSHVCADLAAREILGINGDDDLHFVGQFAQHAHLVIGRKTRKDARGVHVVDQLAAKLQVELAAEFAASLGDVPRLHLDVLITVKTDAVHASSEVAEIEEAVRAGRAGAVAPSGFHCKADGAPHCGWGTRKGADLTRCVAASPSASARCGWRAGACAGPNSRGFRRS